MTRAATTAILLAVGLTGCGPVQSGRLLVDAQAELTAAETAAADKEAPFEYVAAEQYLHKAREEQSRSEYEIAVAFAGKARDCARAAREIAEAKTRAALGAKGAAASSGARCAPGRGDGERARAVELSPASASPSSSSPTPSPSSSSSPPPPQHAPPPAGRPQLPAPVKLSPDRSDEPDHPAKPRKGAPDADTPETPPLGPPGHGDAA